jgi:threonine/homoserine/homoserine lactone efflux protein
MQWIRIFFTGLFISFLGTLPLGTLNAAILQVSASEGILPAIYFSLGALIVEMVYVRLSLVAMDWVRQRKKLFEWFEWISIFIVVLLAIGSFMAATKESNTKNIILGNSVPPFILGLGLSAINPVQIPFWFGWSTVLFARKILLPINLHYNIYIAGIGIGTFIGNAVFVFGGRFVVKNLNTNMQMINWVIGAVFALTALIMIWKKTKLRLD